MSLINRWSVDRRGVALPLALFTLVIAAVMITAVFYVGRLEQRMGYNSVAATQAFEAAETGITATMAGWTAATYGGMAPGDTLTLPTTLVGANSEWTGTVRRLNPNMFLIRAEGRFRVAGQVLTRRQVARIVKLDPAPLNPNAALTTRRGLQVAGSAQITGVDVVPAAWPVPGVCPAAGSSVPAVHDSSGNVTGSGGCFGLSCLTGSTQVFTDPAGVNTSTFNQFGAESYANLASMADRVYTTANVLSTLGPRFSGGTCNTGPDENWGDPDNPASACGNFFPIIHSTGDLTLDHGVGQGILLVDGDLYIRNDVRFYGIAIVQRNIITNGGEIIGATMVNNVLGAPTRVDSSTKLTYSRCALNRANTIGAQPTALENRSWIQMY